MTEEQSKLFIEYNYETIVNHFKDKINALGVEKLSILIEEDSLGLLRVLIYRQHDTGMFGIALILIKDVTRIVQDSALRVFKERVAVSGLKGKYTGAIIINVEPIAQSMLSGVAFSSETTLTISAHSLGIKLVD